ncbi:hypothetical protein FKM82_019989 [Ascaphus truei]
MKGPCHVLCDSAGTVCDSAGTVCDSTDGDATFSRLGALYVFPTQTHCPWGGPHTNIYAPLNTDKERPRGTLSGARFTPRFYAVRHVSVHSDVL